MQNTHILRTHLPLKLQLTIDLWNTITPNNFHMSENVHILRIHPLTTTIDNRSFGIPLHQISFTYSRMHIYWGYIYTHINRMHIYWGYFYPSNCNIADTKLFHYSRMHIYWGYIYPLHSNWQKMYGIHIYWAYTGLSPTHPIDNRSME